MAKKKAGDRRDRAQVDRSAEEVARVSADAAG
jgi:hypothetical protein